MSHALVKRCFTFSPPSAIHFFEGSKPDHTKSWLYAVCSLSYLGAMVSSNSALQYVNYPTQVRPCSLPGHIQSVKTRCLLKIKKIFGVAAASSSVFFVVTGVGEIVQAHPR